MRSSMVHVCAVLMTAWLSLVATAIRADVTFSNASADLVVRGGAANNGLVPADGYFRYTDKTVPGTEETTWSIDPVLISPTGAVSVLSNALLGNPVDLGNGIARSTATVDNGQVTVTADTSLDGRVARNQFRFDAAVGASLAGYKFVFYAENDLFSAADVATFTGSIAGGDLRLFQFDNSQSDFFVEFSPNDALTSNATLALFGCQNWTAFGTALEAGNLSVLSADGSNFITDGDLGLAFQWDLAGVASASVGANYGVSTVIPEPTIATLVVATASFLRWRRRP